MIPITRINRLARVALIRKARIDTEEDPHRRMALMEKQGRTLDALIAALRLEQMAAG